MNDKHSEMTFSRTHKTAAQIHGNIDRAAGLTPTQHPPSFTHHPLGQVNMRFNKYISSPICGLAILSTLLTSTDHVSVVLFQPPRVAPPIDGCNGPATDILSCILIAAESPFQKHTSQERHFVHISLNIGWWTINRLPGGRVVCVPTACFGRSERGCLGSAPEGGGSEPMSGGSLRAIFDLRQGHLWRRCRSRVCRYGVSGRGGWVPGDRPFAALGSPQRSSQPLPQPAVPHAWGDQLTPRCSHAPRSPLPPVLVGLLRRR